MRIIDVAKTAQGNLVRSKLRTGLTIVAVFIGALTISLTNGVGNGVKSYVNKQLGNLGVANTLIVQAKQTVTTPGSDTVQTYDPNKAIGQFNLTFLTASDESKIQAIAGVVKVTPLYSTQLTYITSGGTKYVATGSQYIDGLNLEMAAGNHVDSASDNQVTLPLKYVSVLGYSDPQAAIGQTVTLGVTTALGKVVTLPVKIVGVQQSSLLGNGEINVSSTLARKVQQTQSAGVASLNGKYGGYLATYDPNLTDIQVSALKKRFDDKGYQAMTIQDKIGIVSQVISTIQIGLNVFGAIALLAASFGIVNTLLMAVNERTREIGLMKALGMSQRSIFSIFSFEAMSLGFWGALFGVLVSMAIGNIVNRIASNSFLKDFKGFNLLAFPLLPSVEIIALIVAISFIAGALPSLKASKLDPIEALRYE